LFGGVSPQNPPGDGIGVGRVKVFRTEDGVTLNRIPAKTFADKFDCVNFVEPNYWFYCILIIK